MRRVFLVAIACSGVLYAPLPLIAQNGGGEAPLIPVADMPDSSGGATAPPLEVDPERVPELVPTGDAGEAEAPHGGADAPGPDAPDAVPVPAPDPAPVAPPAPEAAPALAPAADLAQDPTVPEDPVDPPDQAPTDDPTPDVEEPDDEEFEEDFGDLDESDDAPDDPVATGPTPRAGPQLPQTGANIPPVLLSGLALTAAGMSLRSLCRGRVQAL
ncbi:MAG TPA: hypothetical protein VD790_13490 [Thermoleophilaceae bacterium]|nr:hypothetical protein [Thermoleophilaceae bacterium]